jgi:serine/threonine protein phosphatase PrpC
MPTQKTKTLDSDLQWKIVIISIFRHLAYFARDRLNGDPNCGIFGVFDGHGGRQVADHCAERVPDELRKEIAKTVGDLSYALEQVFLRVQLQSFMFYLD